MLNQTNISEDFPICKRNSTDCTPLKNTEPKYIGEKKKKTHSIQSHSLGTRILPSLLVSKQEFSVL